MGKDLSPTQPGDASQQSAAMDKPAMRRDRNAIKEHTAFGILALPGDHGSRAASARLPRLARQSSRMTAKSNHTTLWAVREAVNDRPRDGDPLWSLVRR